MLRLSLNPLVNSHSSDVIFIYRIQRVEGITSKKFVKCKFESVGFNTPYKIFYYKTQVFLFTCILGCLKSSFLLAACSTPMPMLTEPYLKICIFQQLILLVISVRFWCNCKFCFFKYCVFIILRSNCLLENRIKQGNQSSFKSVQAFCLNFCSKFVHDNYCNQTDKLWKSDFSVSN